MSAVVVTLHNLIKKACFFFVHTPAVDCDSSFSFGMVGPLKRVHLKFRLYFSICKKGFVRRLIFLFMHLKNGSTYIFHVGKFSFY